MILVLTMGRLWGHRLGVIAGDVRVSEVDYDLVCGRRIGIVCLRLYRI